MLLHLDFLALKSGHSQWVLDLTCTFDGAIAEMGPGGGRVGVLPGWKWARALAMRNLEGVSPFLLPSTVELLLTRVCHCAAGWREDGHRAARRSHRGALGRPLADGQRSVPACD